MSKGLNAIASYVGGDSGLHDAFTMARMYHGVQPVIHNLEVSPKATRIEIPLPTDWQERLNEVGGQYKYNVQGSRVYVAMDSPTLIKNPGIRKVLDGIEAMIGLPQQRYITVASLDVENGRLSILKNPEIGEIQDDLISRMQRQ